MSVREDLAGDDSFVTMLDVKIDGAEFKIPAGLTILDALTGIGIELPSLCHDPRLDGGGDCRLCSVQVQGEQHTSTACTRKLAQGMSIVTRTPELEAFRRRMFELLAAHCSTQSFQQLPDKPLHRWLAHYAIEPALESVTTTGHTDESHPYFRFDPEQCIGCYRCVRVCEDLQGQFVWHMLGRGPSSRLAVDQGNCLADSSCVACGACADACPTAALADKGTLQHGAAESWTRTTCTYCGVGCELRVGVREGHIVEVRPELGSPVSKGHLCSKGRYAWSFGSAHDRVTRPMLRVAGVWSTVSWDQALDRAAAELTRIRARYGADAIGVLGSARATNEENYLIQKFARLVLGTNNVDCCARVCHTPTAAAMKHMLGTGAATNSFDDIELARTILVAGANATENHPVVGARIKQQARRGATLIVIDPRRIELAEYATVHLAPKPGTNIPLLHAMAHVIFAEHLHDAQFIQDRVEGLAAFQAFVRDFSPERAAGICGVAVEDIRAAARLYAREKPAMCFHGLGMTEHLQGTEGVMSLVNLALLTGNIGRPGAGINPLRGQNNVQGAAVMGCEPGSLTGSVPLDDARSRFEAAWGAALPDARGMHLLQMIDAAAAGRLKALYVVGYDVLLTLANTAEVRRALQQVETVIVQDFAMNATAREFGTIFLPVANVFEKDGTFMNAERRIQRVRKAVEAPGLARTDARIVTELAGRLGAASGFAFADAAHVWDEVRTVWPAVAGISYERLDTAGLQWPCPSPQHPGTTVLHGESFAGKKRAALECVEFVPTPEHIDPEFPFLLTTGRNIYQFNAGTMTGRTPHSALRPHDTLDIAPTDARALSIGDGTDVLVTSRHGCAVLPARIDPRLRAGELFATFHDDARFVNRLTSSVRDRRVGAPEYKVTAVRIEIAGLRSI